MPPGATSSHLLCRFKIRLTGPAGGLQALVPLRHGHFSKARVVPRGWEGAAESLAVELKEREKAREAEMKVESEIQAVTANMRRSHCQDIKGRRIPAMGGTRLEPGAAAQPEELSLW